MSQMRPHAEFACTLREVARFMGVDVRAKAELSISGVSADSRQILPGDLFFALPGLKHHGADFADQIIARGAVAVVTDAVGALKLNGKIPTITLDRPETWVGDVSSWFYNSPFSAVGAVGITGTNGKTTTASLLFQLWRAAGRSAGFIGTTGISIDSENLPAHFTTPQPAELQSLVATMRERHLKNVVMEVSSHAIAQRRIGGARFAAVAFSNLTQDHLDFHGDMESYFAAKSKLFTSEYSDVAVINVDDEYGKRLANSTSLELIALSRSNNHAQWYYESCELAQSGFGYEVAIRGTGGVLIQGHLPLIGEHNLDNALMAIALASLSEVDPIFIAAELKNLKAPHGRLEPVTLGQSYLALVDYAHTPDAVAHALSSARNLVTSRGGRVIGVLGCGGDRDKSKRPIMGDLLVAGSNLAIFTSDNPRSEDPDQILAEMLGSHQVGPDLVVERDRRGAIAVAVAEAKPGDCIVVLGKGHEVGQEVAGVKHPFDDRLELARAIEQFG